MKRKLLALMISLAVILTAFPLVNSISYAASSTSDVSGAWNAYYKLLNEKSFYRDLNKDPNSQSHQRWYSKNCSFMIAYLDDNDIPELLVSNYYDSNHASGWGVIYTFTNGSLSVVNDIQTFSGVQSNGGFYERTGWYLNTYFGTGGYGTESYENTASSKHLDISYEVDANDKHQVTGYSIDNRSCTKTAFESELNKVTGGKSLTPYKFYKNTRKNRDVIIKNKGKFVSVDGNQYMIRPSETKKATFVKAANKKKVKVPNSVKINGKTYKVNSIFYKAFTGKKIRTVTIGKNVKSIAKNAFTNSKTNKIIIKSKKLKKKSVKGCLKSSKVKTIKVKTGKGNKRTLNKYKKFFTKKNAGRKVKVN